MSQKLCRSCLKDTKEGHAITESLKDRSILSHISELTGVDIDVDDGFPQEICSNCLSDLEKAIEFRERILTADHRLRSIGLHPEVKLEEVDFDDDIKDEPDDDRDYVPSSSISPMKKARKRGPPPKKVNKKRKPESLQCCMCGENFSTEDDLEKHCVATHPGGKMQDTVMTMRHKYECQYCKQRFRMKRFLSEHFKDINYEEPKRDRTKDLLYKKNYYDKQAKKVCSICGLQLRDQRSLEVHETSKHSTVRNIVCGIGGCKAAFGHDIVLKKHQRACHSEKKYTCDYCGKSFVYFRQLKQHIFLHMEKKPFQCNQCDKTYTLERVLQAHIIASHSELEYPFQCDLCEKAYKWKEDLRAHRSAYHFGKFPFVCKYCGKGYTSSSNRNWHEKRCTLGQAQRLADTSLV